MGIFCTARYFKNKYIKILVTICITLELETALCSRVFDGMEKKAIKVSEYCPKTKNCEEGSHVICMYYNPNKVAGPSCSELLNITITADLALRILEITNGMRAKVAQGKETGKDNQYLPKAYGMMRLRWDSELATFAQVLANQCGRLRDLCRASNRFPDPEQNFSVIRFVRPIWNITVIDGIAMKVNSTKLFEKGLNEYKIIYGIYKMMEKWYVFKQFLEASHILNYPDFSKDQTNIEIKRLANVLSGSATHIGCGMSAFSSYAYSNRSENKYNSIILVCNISGGPKPGKPLYETNPPTKVGYTIRCGCPPGYEEDDDCMCYEDPQTTPSVCDGFNKNCKPAVVLLPIVTAEDAPPSKLSRRRGHDKAFNMYDKYEDDVNNDDFGSFVNRVNVIGSDSNSYLPTIPYFESETSTKRDYYKYMMTKPKMKDVKKLYFDKKHNKKIRLGHEIGPFRNDNGRMGHDLRLGQRDVRLSNRKANFDYESDNNNFNDDAKDKRMTADEKRSLSKEEIISGPENKILRSGKEREKAKRNEPGEYLPLKKKTPHHAKESLFSRVPKFELPSNTIHSQKIILKSDVAPRRDFTNAKNLLENYLKKRKESQVLKQFKSSILYPNKLIDRIMPKSNTYDLDRYLTRRFNYPEMEEHGNNEHRPIEIKASNEESDKKLMILLDTLEREVNNIELNVNEKEMFDAKIRKIYGQVVGKPPETLLLKNLSDIVAEKTDDRNDEYGHVFGKPLEALSRENVADIVAEENYDRQSFAAAKLSDFSKYETAVNNHLAMEKSDEDDPFILKPRPQNNLSFKVKYKLPAIRSIENDANLRSYKKSNHNDLFKLRSLKRNFIQSDYETSPTKYSFENDNRNKPRFYKRKTFNDDVKYPEKTRFKHKENGKRRYYGNDEKIQKTEKQVNQFIKNEYNDILDAERRKYYQDKLDRIERKLHEVRKFRNRSEVN